MFETTLSGAGELLEDGKVELGHRGAIADGACSGNAVDGARQAKNSGWLGTSQRWTVSSTGTALRMVEGGHGFAWLPEWVVRTRLASGQLLKVPLQHQASREVALQMGYTEGRIQDAAVRGLAEIIRRLCAHERIGLGRLAA